MTIEGGEPEEVEPDEAVVRIANGAFLLDVREQDEWDAGHAPEARHIPLGELEERWGEIPADQEIICVCRGGGRSARAARREAHSSRKRGRGGTYSLDSAFVPIIVVFSFFYNAHRQSVRQ